MEKNTHKAIFRTQCPVLISLNLYVTVSSRLSVLSNLSLVLAADRGILISQGLKLIKKYLLLLFLCLFFSYLMRFSARKGVNIINIIYTHKKSPNS